MITPTSASSFSQFPQFDNDKAQDIKMSIQDTMDMSANGHCAPYNMQSVVPPELVISIFSSMDWRMLVRCSIVCRFWNHLIRDTLSLQYKIELGANGMDDGPADGMAISERLKALSKYRQAWRTLNFSRVATVPMPGECHAYELVGGVFAKAMNPHHDLTSLGNPGSRHISLVALPSATQEPRTLVREDIGLLCRDFGIDPTQDLIVLVEQPKPGKPAVTVHLRAVSTNERHPRAECAVLCQPMKTGFEGAEIQICDDIIAIVVRIQNIPRVMIWQWTTGKCIMTELVSTAFRHVDDFSLISSYAFMTTNRFPQGSLDVYAFRTPAGKLLSSTPMKLSTLKSVSLLLPALQSSNQYAEINSHTSPFTGRVRKGAPFVVSEEARIHVLSVTTQPSQPSHSNSDSELSVGPPGRAASFVVIVLNRVMLKYIDLALASSMPGVMEIVWEDWGPRNSRWLPERSSYAWQRYVHGSRLVRTLHSAWPSTRCRMQVLDFCVFPSRQGAEVDRANEAADLAEANVPCSHRLVAGPSLICDRGFRGGGVESRLPYREATLKAEFGPYSGFMIDEERVIGLSAMTFANGDMKQVDVFTF